MSENIVYNDALLELAEIAEIAKHSKFILFTHQSISVLSSGALMDSIRMGTMIIGPNFGAFRDLVPFGLVKTYEVYEDIINMCRNFKESDHSTSLVNSEKFYVENDWNGFASKLHDQLQHLFIGHHNSKQAQ